MAGFSGVTVYERTKLRMKNAQQLRCTWVKVLGLKGRSGTAARASWSCRCAGGLCLAGLRWALLAPAEETVCQNLCPLRMMAGMCAIEEIPSVIPGRRFLPIITFQWDWVIPVYKNHCPKIHLIFTLSILFNLLGEWRHFLSFQFFTLRWLLDFGFPEELQN